MKLLYIWVENFKCFINNEFNFSSNYKFSYEYKDNIMSISCCNNNSLQLFNNKESDYTIQDITVIVGENGVGKTTLSELFLSPVDLSRTKDSNKRLYIFEENGSIDFNYYGDWTNPSELRIDPDNILIKKKINNYLQNSCICTSDIFYSKNISLIYDTNTFSYQSKLKNEEYSETNYIDLSLGGRYLKNNKTYFYDEFNSQMEFIINEKDIIEKNIDFNFPNAISMNVYDIKLRSYYPKTDEKDLIIQDTINNLETQKIQFKYTLMLISFIYTNKLLFKSVDLNKEKPCLDNIRKEYSDIFKKKFKKINELSNLSSLDAAKKVIETLYEDNKTFIQRKNKELKYLNRSISNLDEMIHLSVHLTFNEKTEETFHKSIDISSEKKLKDFKKFFEKCKELEKYIGFNWVLSTGENAFLNILSKYHSIKTHLTNKSVLIFIDEADLYLHPRWQQRYISLIIEYLTVLLKDKKLQLIITTHSPIILSDIPKNHVIFMNKNSNGTIITNDNASHSETFGGNIFNLYNDSFFLNKDKNGEAIGMLASRNIEKISAILRKTKNIIDVAINTNNEDNIDWKKYEKDIEYCNNIINVIGEPIYSIALKSQCSWIESIRNKSKYYKENETRINALYYINKMGLSREHSQVIKEILKDNRYD